MRTHHALTPRVQRGRPREMRIGTGIASGIARGRCHPAQPGLGLCFPIRDTSMNKAVGIVLLVIGVILLILGFNASESFASEVSETVTGNPTNRSIWFLLGGAVATVAGLIGVLRGRGA